MSHAESLALLIKTQDRVIKYYELKVRELSELAREQSELIEWLSNKHEGFYLSPQWLELRTRVLETYGSVCMACGSTPADGSVIQVDHIKPKSLHPHLALNFSNLQVLCLECNAGKSNKSERDWRPNIIASETNSDSQQVLEEASNHIDSITDKETIGGLEHKALEKLSISKVNAIASVSTACSATI